MRVVSGAGSVRRAMHVSMTGKDPGLTLLELMITISVLAIVTAISVPAMTKFIANLRQVTQANNFIADIVYARNEAATRGVRVTLCASQNVDTAANPTCAATGTTAWETGRIIFVDSNGNGVKTSGESLLKKSSGLPTGYSLTASGFSDPSYLTFSTYGGLTPSTAGSFKVCSTSITSGYRIAVAATGQPLSTQVTCP